MTLPGLARDAVLLERQAEVVDAEGNAVGAWATTFDGRGTYGTPSARDREVAAQRGATVDAVVAISSAVPVQLGDRATVRSEQWVVTAVVDVRLHQRLFLRRVEP